MAYVRETDYVVVGAGVMGAATAWALSRSGRNVVVLEQHVPGNRRGSSHGRSRIFRLSYPESAYVEMARHALKLWRRVEEESGEQLVTTMGGFDLGDGISANAAALEAAGATFEELTSAQARRRFPSIGFPSLAPVLYQPDAGVIAAQLSLASLLRIAAARGVEIRESERAVALEPGDDSVRVRTEHGIFQAKAAVITAGAWAAPLLETAGIGLPVTVTLETVGYFEVRGDVPPPVVEWGDPAFYCLASPGQGIKAAQHHAGPEIDPDAVHQPSARSMEAVSAWVQERFPNASSTPYGIETCLYTNTSDESFVLKRHGPIVVGSPCSGHGFKFAPLIGTRLASLAEGLEG